MKLEHRINDYRPDVVLYKNGYRLLVEIAVTHFVDDEKLAKIKRDNLSCIEIDLSCNCLNSKEDWERVRKIILDESLTYSTNNEKNKVKYWIYHIDKEKHDNKIKFILEKLRLEEQHRYSK